MIFDAVNNFRQPECGYRFSADSLMLSEFVQAGQATRLADLGAGCGIVGLAALEKGRAPAAEELFFVEVSGDFMGSLAANLGLYRPRVAAHLRVLHRDWRDLRPSDFGGPLDYIMVNPPYFPQGRGRPSPNPAVNAARHEVHGGLEALCAALNRLLAPQGRAALVLPVERETELLRALRTHGLEPERISRPENRLILAEAGSAGIIHS